MELPIELFITFIGTSIALALFGFLRNPQIPAMLTFGGIFILFIAVTTESIIMGFAFNGDSPDETQQYNIFTSTGTDEIRLTDRVINAEGLANSASELNGKEINCVEFNLRKLNNPPIDTPLIFAVFDNNGIIKHEFGRMNVTMLTNAVTPYEFCSNDIYTLVTLDRIGVSYKDGDSTNRVLIMVDGTDPFDGSNTLQYRFNNGTQVWSANSSGDITAKFTLKTNGGGILTQDVLFEFTELPKVIFSLLGAIFMLSGALMVFRGER